MTSNILIVDDNPLNIELLEGYLSSSNYAIAKATNGLEALERVEADKPDLILLDIMMPGLNGYEVCKHLKDNPGTRLIPIIMLTALHDIKDKVQGLEAGADDFISKPFNNIELTTRIKSLLRIKHLNDELEDMESIVVTLARAIEAKDLYTRGHSERVAKYAEELAKYLGISISDQILLRRSGFLHDIGKIGVPGNILNKPDSLSDLEVEEINKHTIISAEILKPLRSARQVIPIIRHHHEKWNGTGQPDKLKGEDIPLLARILTVADIYDALTTDRSYRPRMTQEKAFKVLLSEAGTSCDPDIVNNFIKMMEEAEQQGRVIVDLSSLIIEDDDPSTEEAIAP